MCISVYIAYYINITAYTYTFANIWVFPKTGGTTKLSICCRMSSIINHPFWGTRTFVLRNPHMGNDMVHVQVAR